ncbi:MAG: hypothetical protein RLZZ568_1595 [Cyanobacteriota bacterium]
MPRYCFHPYQVKKSSRGSRWGLLAMFVIVGVAGCTSLRSRFEAQPDNPPFREFAQVTESVQQIATPKTHVRTRRVDNPSAGRPQQFSSQTATNLDQQVKQIKYYGTSVEELVHKIGQLASNDWEKARLAYSWITQNIAYDVVMAQTRNIDDLRPETVLAGRQTICSRYANLYQALAQALRLDVVTISNSHFEKSGGIEWEG